MTPHGKACTKCGEVKPLDEYHRDSSRKDGRDNKCRPCKSWKNKDYMERNGEKVREINRISKKRNREKILEDKRRYYAENRDILKSLNRESLRQLRGTVRMLSPKMGEPFSSYEDDFLMEESGLTVYQKAVELGRTYNSCVNRRARLRSRAHN